MFNVLHAPFNAVHEPIGLGVAGRQAGGNVDDDLSPFTHCSEIQFPC